MLLESKIATSSAQARAGARVVTLILITLNLSVTAWIHLYEMRSPSFSPISLSVSWDTVFLQDQWWRLISALFVQITVYHLVGNMIELWFFGTRIGLIYGIPLYLFVFAFGGAVGSLVAIWCRPLSYGFGASGATMSLLGALIVYHFRYRNELSRAGMWKLVLITIYAAVGVLPDIFHPFSGAAVHPVGLAVGAALGVAFSSYGHRRMSTALWETQT